MRENESGYTLRNRTKQNRRKGGSRFSETHYADRSHDRKSDRVNREVKRYHD